MMYRADKIRAALGVKDWTDQELADRTGLRRQTISLIKRGGDNDVRLSSLISICDALGIPLQSLFEEEPEVANVA